MTEYDFSPEAYEQYVRGQHKIASWVSKTNQVPKADPYQAATPAFDVPRELLPLDRHLDSSAPWDGKKKAKKRRTPSEKEFDRERRNDYKYSHREHMDALHAATARPEAHRSQTAPVQRARRISYDGRAAPPPPLPTRSLHPTAGYPADHRFSDSQDTSSSADTYGFSQPNRNQKRSASVQSPTRVLYVPMSVKGPTPLYTCDPNINAQVDTSPPPRRTKPTRSHISPLPRPPASAPVYSSSPYRQQHYNGSHTFPRQQQQQHRPLAYPYTSSPLSPPDSAPAYSKSQPRLSAPVIPEPPINSRSTHEGRPFLQRVLKHLPGLRMRDRSPSSSTRSRSQPPSHAQSRPETPTSPTKSSWLGSPTKNKLTKAGRSRTSLDQWSAISPAGVGHEKGWLRSSLDTREGSQKAKEWEFIDHEEAKEKDKERGRGKSRAHDVHREGSERWKEKDREKSRRRDWPREREREREWERHDTNREQPRPSRNGYRERERSFDRDRQRERGRDRERAAGRDWERGDERERTPRHARPKEKTRDRDRDERERRRGSKEIDVHWRGSA
ncbi:hypothetical protein C0991_002435 [Blastosporella zonata]|nr:hypothetical protein C0991_002435 [Blastosporella zonata]